MRTMLIMQVRSSSTRLPGKALLPVAGFPSSVLAAMRATNRGHEIRVATSTDSSDDQLAEIFVESGFKVVRGPLHDVLARFVMATADLPPDCVVIRLTADNVIPDGHLVEELEKHFHRSGVAYVYHAYPQSHLPYGLGAEAFSVATLREAHAAAASAYDREHVTPWVARHCRLAIHVPKEAESLDLSHLRCTIDDLEDYERVCSLFDGVDQPVQCRWGDLARKLAGMPGEPRFRVAYKVAGGRVHSEFTLGTAQLGMDYGIANRSGKPVRPTAIAMVRKAIAHGVTSIDTACAYGDAEQVLGQALSGAWRSRVAVITKLDILGGFASNIAISDVRASVDESVKRSCEALATNQLSTVLLHTWRHYRQWNGAVWHKLMELRDSGTIRNLGASVYAPNEALEALRDPAIQHLQIPMNVLDRRWKSAGVDRACAERPDVVVHARSALLQGLLAAPAELWPVVPLSEASNYLGCLREFAKGFGRDGVVDLCIAYVRSQPWITSIVVGCETMGQLEDNLRWFHAPHLTEGQCLELELSLPIVPDALLNPSKWNLVHEPSAR